MIKHRFVQILWNDERNRKLSSTISDNFEGKKILKREKFSITNTYLSQEIQSIDYSRRFKSHWWYIRTPSTNKLIWQNKPVFCALRKKEFPISYSYSISLLPGDDLSWWKSCLSKVVTKLCHFNLWIMVNNTVML